MATGHNIAMGLRSAYLLMHRQTNAFLASYDLTADQFVLLHLLADKDGITQQELTRRASSDPNTVRAMLVRMENNGFLTRENHPSDRRARRVKLTRKGRTAFSRITREIVPLQQALTAGFTVKEADTLLLLLARISDAMIQWETDQADSNQRKAI